MRKMSRAVDVRLGALTTNLVTRDRRRERRPRLRLCARARYDPRQALTAEPWWPAEACRLTLARAARNGQRLQSLLGPRSTCGQRLKVSTPGGRVDAMRSRKDRHSTPAACSMRHISRVSGANCLAACRVGVAAFGAAGLPLPMVRVGGLTRPPMVSHGQERLATVAGA